MPRRRTALAALVVALAATIAAPVGAAPGGRVDPASGASGHGDLAGVPLVRPTVAVQSTPSGGGYWLVASDGGVFAFGDAGFFGSTGDIALHRPIVGMASTPSGGGYWLVASDGGVFAFGDAGFFGSTGAIALSRPIVGMASTPSGGGYWLVASDGGVFAFGDAVYHGSAPGEGLVEEFIGIISSATGGGYSLVGSDGRLVAIGDAGIADGAMCDRWPVISAAPAGPGAVLLRQEVPVPGGPAGAASSLADSDSIATMVRAAQGCQAPREPVAGELSVPVSSPLRTSPYGSRVHPIWKVRQLHAGVDLVSASGTLGAPARAAMAGTVIEVTARVAYGLNVVIDHGDGIATVYAHLATAAVAVGDVVAVGQTVGTIGTSGFATGAHLHFELRLDGDPVDPTPFLPGVSAARVLAWPAVASVL